VAPPAPADGGVPGQLNAAASGSHDGPRGALTTTPPRSFQPLRLLHEFAASPAGRPAKMAATNKYLARSNKSRTGPEATKKTEKPYRRSTSVPAGGS
jgi:hypothetical protein